MRKTKKSFWQFFRMHLRRSDRLYLNSTPGLRVYALDHLFDDPVPIYCGNFPRHILILMEQGGAAFRRNGETLVARAGDALIIERGEGTLQFFTCHEFCGMIATVVEFEERALSRHFLGAPNVEALALYCRELPGCGSVLKNLTPQVISVTKSMGLFYPACSREILAYTCHNPVGRSIPFARRAFFRPRWKLLMALEHHVFFADAVARLAAVHPSGEEGLRRDCRTFIGRDPEKWLLHRRMEIADLWLRSERTLDEVAQAFGFTSRWEFQCTYGAFMHRRAEDACRERINIATMGASELAELLRPFWWPAPLPLVGIAGHEPEPVGFLPGLFTPEIEEDITELLRAQAAAGRRSPILASDEDVISEEKLRAGAQEFCEMKNTAAEVIVPIFFRLKEEVSQKTMAA